MTAFGDSLRLMSAQVRMSRFAGALLVVGVVMGSAIPIAARDAPPVIGGLWGRLNRALTHRCLSPAAGQAMSDLVATGALQSVLGGDFTLAGGKLSGDQIEVAVQDDAQRSYIVTLALPGVKEGDADGQGERFVFYLGAANPPNPRAANVLLELAARFDRAIPDSAFERCAGGDESRGERRYSRAVALTSAIVEAAIIVFAILFGWRAVRTTRPYGE